MEKEFQEFIETQKGVNEQTTKAIEFITTNLGIMNERIKVSHDRMDSQGKQLDKILEIIKVIRYELDTLQEWKLAKEGI